MKAHPGSCSVDTHAVVSFLGKSWPDVKLTHSPLYRAEVNNTDIQQKISIDEISLLWLFCGC